MVVHDGKLKAMYLVGEDMYSADSNANFVGGGFEKLDFFLLADLPLCGCGTAGESEPGEGRYVHQHGAALSTPVSGDGAARREQARLEDHSGSCLQAWSRLDLHASGGRDARGGVAGS